MKKLIFFAAGIVLLAACSKSKNVKPALTPQNATIANVTGKWLATIDTVFAVQNSQTTTTIEGNTGGFFFQFNSNGTGLEGETANPDILDFTFTVEDGNILIHTNASNGNPAEDVALSILAISDSKLGLSLSEGTSKENIHFVKE